MNHEEESVLITVLDHINEAVQELEKLSMDFRVFEWCTHLNKLYDSIERSIEEPKEDEEEE